MTVGSTPRRLGRLQRGLTPFVVAWLLWLCPGTLWAAEPANPYASASTRAVLRYLEDLPSHPSNRVLIGQFIGHAAPPGQAAALRDPWVGYRMDVEKLQRRTGKWVALVGADYARLSNDATVDLARANEPLIAHWRQGGLVTVSWHARNPWTGGDARDHAGSERFDELLTPGTEAYATWMRALDEVADALAQLQKAGVVVLWRPFHESNEPPFWWGQGMATSPPPAQVVALWRRMFEYFTLTKRLNNLLWVYAATASEKPGAQSEWLCYPGDEFVDVVGLDVYADRLTLGAYEAMRALRKPMGLTEFGPSEETARARSYDYGQLMPQIESRYPGLSFVFCWGGSSRPPRPAWGLLANRHADQLLRHPWVITRDEVDWKAYLPH